MSDYRLYIGKKIEYEDMPPNSMSSFFFLLSFFLSSGKQFNRITDESFVSFQSNAACLKGLLLLYT